jgi:hypothetical protein
MQLLSKMVTPGASVVSASSQLANLDAYAIRQTDGRLSLLVINKSPAGLNLDTTGTPLSISATFNLSGFVPAPQAQFWQYGSAEDNAQKSSTNGAASLTSFNQALSLAGSSFTHAFPSYSMTVIELMPAPAPQVVYRAYLFETSPNQIEFTFDTDLSVASLAPSDLVLTRQGGGPVPAVQSVQWNSATKTATFTLAPGAPQDGDYTATLPAGSVIGANSVPLAGNQSVNFHVLAGDADRDRDVDLDDFNILATNFGASGKTFSQGNFDYDPAGNVNLDDFNLLAGRFGVSLVPRSRVLTVLDAGKRGDADRLDLLR